MLSKKSSYGSLGQPLSPHRSSVPLRLRALPAATLFPAPWPKSTAGIFGPSQPREGLRIAIMTVFGGDFEVCQESGRGTSSVIIRHHPISWEFPQNNPAMGYPHDSGNSPSGSIRFLVLPWQDSKQKSSGAGRSLQEMKEMSWKSHYFYIMLGNSGP